MEVTPISADPIKCGLASCDAMQLLALAGTKACATRRSSSGISGAGQLLRLDLCMQPLTQSYKILRGDKTKRGFVFRGQPCPQAPPQDGGASALPIFLRFTSVHAYTFCCRRTTIFGVVTCGGGTRVLGVSYTPPISRDRSSGLRNFGDSPVF